MKEKYVKPKSVQLVETKNSLFPVVSPVPVIGLAPLRLFGDNIIAVRHAKLEEKF